MTAQPTRYAHNGPVDIAFDDLGGAGGEPLLLVMGLGVSRFWWPAGLVAALVARGFHVVAYDQRDAGESTHFPPTPARNPLAALLRRRPPAYTAEEMTDDAVAVLDALGWDSAHLFGHSMGGLLAQRTALRHPDRVRSITTSAALPSDVTGLGSLRHLHPGFLYRLTRLRHPADRAGDIAAGLELAGMLAGPGYPVDEAVVRPGIERDAASGVRDTAAQSRQIGASWHGPRLATLRLPALVLHGAADPLVRPTAGRRTAAAIAGARFVEFPGVGHDLPAPLWPRVAAEVRAVADTAAGRPAISQ